MKKHYFFISFVIIAIITSISFVYENSSKNFSSEQNNTSKSVLSFQDCVKKGYPVLESRPRQCKTPDNKTFAEEIQEQALYSNATTNDITITLPYPGAVTGKTFSVTGKARGYWYFEASFPVEIIDSTGKTIAKGIATAQSDWMTENFVLFKSDIIVPESYTGKAVVVLKKDNPSGIKEKDASVSIPITIEY